MKKSQKLIQLILLLSRRGGVSKEKCMCILEISSSTFYEYKQEIVNFGLEVSLESGLYSIEIANSEGKFFSKLYPLDDEEQYILKKAIDSIDFSVKKQSKLLQKLRLIFENDEVINDILPEKECEILKTVEAAIYSKEQVLIKGYRSGSSLSVKDYLVEPFRVLDGLDMFWAYDVKSKMSKVFKFSRIYALINCRSLQENNYKHKILEIDDFNFVGELKLDVCFEMNLLSRNLLSEEYPRSDRHVKSLSEDKYIYKSKCESYDGPARFVMGLVGNCKSVGCPEFEKFIENKVKKYYSFRESRSGVM